MNPLAIVAVVLTAIVLLFTVVGTALPIARDREYKDPKDENYNEITFWHYQSRTNGNKVVTEFKDLPASQACNKQVDKIKAGSAFAIISIALAATSFAGSIALVAGKVPGIAVAGLSVATSITLIIAWALALAVYTIDECAGGDDKNKRANSLRANHWKVGAGTVLLIIASGLLFIIAALAVVAFFAVGSSAVHNESSSKPSDNNNNNDKKKKDEEDKKKKDEEDKKKKDDDKKKDEEDKKKKDDEKKKDEEDKKKKDEEDKKKKDDDKKKKEEAEKAQQRKKLWHDLRTRLPRRKIPEENKKRDELFKKFDKQGNGYVSFAECQDGAVNILELNKLTKDLNPLLLRAFNAAKDARKSKATGEKKEEQNDYVERVEFRLLLVYIYDYFELWMMFDEIDTSDDHRVSLDEFKQAIPMIKSWGLTIDNPEAAFKTIDASGGGVVSFDEFAEWAAKNHLDMDGDAENDDVA